VTVIYEETLLDSVCANQLTIFRKWLAIDDCGNADSVTQTVTVMDTIPPVLSAYPNDTTVECIDQVPPADAITATDNCDDVPVIYEKIISDSICENQITITRIWSAVDECNNEVSHTQLVTVIDTVPPVLSAIPNDTIVECIEDIPPAEAITATDNCDDVPVLYSETVLDSICSNQITITRTWTAVDECGNAVSASQTVTVWDTIPPVIQGDIADTTVACFVDIPDPADVIATDNCDIPDIVFNETITDSVCINGLIITRTWTATDDCGNSAFVEQEITVNDTIPPEIICPDDIEVQCEGDVPAPDITLVTASDNCGPAEIIHSGDSISDGTCPQLIYRTYMATDLCGNSAECIQIITVNDTIPPTIACPPDIFVPIGMSIPDPYSTYQQFTDEGGNANDNCALNEDSFILISADTVSGALADTIFRAYSIADLCDNNDTCQQKIIVETDAGTEIICPDNITSVECFGDVPLPYQTLSEFISAGGQVSSKCYIDTLSFRFAGQVSDGQKCPETLTRTYEISDTCGNTVNCTQQIIIDDTQPPQLNCPPDITVAVGDPVPPAYPDFALFTVNGGTALDNCGIVEESFNLLDEFTTNGIVADTITRTYQIADSCQHTDVCSQIIIVLNDLQLEIICPPDTNVQCKVDVPPIMENYTEFLNAGGYAFSMCGIDPETFTFVSQVSDNFTCPETITRTYMVKDSCGYELTCDHTIIIHDITPPTMTCPPDTFIAVDEDVPSPFLTYAEFILGGGTADDNCGIVESSFNWVNDISDGNTFPETITRTYEVFDSCDNRVICNHLIIVEGDAQLNMSCPPQMQFECYGEVPPPYADYAEYTAAGGTAFSACGLDISTFTFAGQVATGNCPMTITRTYSIKDSCDNTINCTQLIIVDDQTPPLMDCSDDITVYPGESTPAPFNSFAAFISAGGTASDNCGLVETSFHLFEETRDGEHPQIITRTYEIKDSCDQWALCEHIITVYDTSLIQMICPPTIILDCVKDGSNIPEHYKTYDEYLAAGGYAESSPYDIDPSTFAFVSEVPDGNHCPEVITRTYSIENTNSDIRYCKQLIVINDVTPPILRISDKRIDCITDMPIKYTTQAELFGPGKGWADDECALDWSSLRFISESSDGKKCPETIVRIYEIADMCDNIRRANEKIIIDNETPPTIFKTPGDIMDACEVPAPYRNYKEFEQAGGLVVDDCGGFTMSYEGDVITGEGCPRTIIRTYRFTDECGNSSPYIQNIIINDTIPPDFIEWPDDTATVCAPNTFFESYSDFISLGGIVTDNCGVDTTTFRLIRQEVTQVDICPATYINTYEIQDYCGNIDTFTWRVTVDDPIPPEMDCPPDQYIELDAPTPDPFTLYDEFIAAGGSASDNCEIDEDSFILVSMDSIVGTCAITITYTYEISDYCGNTDECTHNVYKGDVAPPELICPPDTFIVCPEDVPPYFETIEEFMAAGGIFTDNGKTNITTFTMINEAVDLHDCPRNIVRTYQITDSCGLTTECIHTITVHDTIPPQMACPPQANFECLDQQSEPFSDIYEFLAAGGTVSDNCDIDTASFVMFDEIINSTQTSIQITRWYSINDLCGNPATCAHTVNLTDTIPPTVLCRDITVQLDETETYTLVTAEVHMDSNDNCGIDTMYLDRYILDCDDLGVNYIQLFVVDVNGNTSSCIARVTVIGNIPPVAVNDTAATLTNIAVDIDITNNDYDTNGSINPATVAITDLPDNGSLIIQPQKRITQE